MAPPATSKPARPDWIPEGHWDADKGAHKETFAQHVKDLTAKVAEAESRKLSLPANPDAYKIELPADFKLPDGITFKFDDTSPLLGEAKKAAHEMGLDQTQFSRLLGLYAGTQLQAEQAQVARYNAEVAKLGAAGPARVDAINTWLDAKGFQDLKPVLFTAASVETIERMMKAFAAQGASTMSSGGRDAEGGGKVNDEQWAKMSNAERLDYARRFDQKQFTNGANR